MRFLEAIRVRFVREREYQSCPNTIPNNAENNGSTCNIQIESLEGMNNQTMAPTRTTLPELPPLNDNQRSFVCCCLTSQSSFRLLLLTYWLWTLSSFVFNAGSVLPALLYLFPFCTMILAFIGSTTGNHQFLIPFVLVIAWDTFYAGICTIILDLFHMHMHGRTTWITKFYYDYWPQKAHEFEAMSGGNYELFMVILFLKFFCTFIVYIITGQEICRLENKKFIEKERCEILHQREVLREREEIRLQNLLNEQQLLQQEQQQPPNDPPQDPYAEIFAQVQPPPSYHTFSHPVLRTPQLGTPPPTYSMLERDGRLQPLPIQWSPTSSQNDGQQRTDSSDISIDLKRSDTASTAMSPSSFLQSPPHSSTSSSNSTKE